MSRTWELLGEVEDVPHRGGAEGVDRLSIVADHGEVLASGAEHLQDLCLKAVGVLILVDQDAVESAANGSGGVGVRQQTVPEEQQVVIVEDALLPFVVDVGGEEATQVVGLVLAPGEARLDHLFHGLPGVDAAAVDVHARAFERKATVVLGESQLGAEDSHEVLGVGAIENGEGRLQADGSPVKAEKAGGRGVEGTAPNLARGRRAGRRRTLRRSHIRGGRGLGGATVLGLQEAQDAIHPPKHLACRPPGEGEQQDPSRVGAVGDLVGDAVRQGGRLPGAGARHDQQRIVAVHHRRALLLVELGEDRPDRGRNGGVIHVESQSSPLGGRRLCGGGRRMLLVEPGSQRQGYRAARTEDRR